MTIMPAEIRVVRVPLVEVGVVVTITTVVVAGTIFGIDILQSFLPDRIGMKLSTATGFYLLAAAVAARILGGTHARVVSGMLAGAVFLLGTAGLIQDLTGVDLWIDRMWMSEAGGAVETAIPGRMAMGSAACFVLLSLSLISSFLRARAAVFVTRVSLMLIAVILLQILAGYVYSAQPLKNLSSVTPMSFPTAVNFVLMTLAVAWLHRSLWPISLVAGHSIASITARNLLLGAMATTAGIGWLRVLGEEAGLYGTKTGAALFTVVNILALWGVTVWCASRLYRTERAQDQTRETLRRALAAQDVIGLAPRDIRSVERAILQEAQSLVEASGAAFVILQRDRIYVQSCIGTASALQGLTLDPESLLSLGLREGRPMTLVSSEDWVDPLLRQMGRPSFAILPLRAGGTSHGALIVFAKRDQGVTEAQLDVLRVISNAAEAALSQAEQADVRQLMLEEQSVELALLQEQFAAFMANIPAAAFIKEESRRYVYGNRSLSQFLGVDSESALGATDEEILPASRAATLKASEAAVLEQEETHAEVVRFEERSWLLLRFPICMRETRRFLGGVAVDITEQKRAEEEIARLNASLEQRVADRTKELERMNEELEAFSYSVSHDLRAPLRAVNGYSRILEETFASELNEDARGLLTIVRSEAHRMGDLIDDLLAFSRVGRQSLLPVQIDLASLAREVGEELQRHEPDRVLDFQCTALPPAFADRSAVRQVLMNLLSNAVKYTRGEGPVRVEIGGVAGSEFNTYSVRDHGVGFDMRHAEGLFKVFQRLPGSERFEGTGVGLAIVERIVTRHGGRVWAEGRVGEGSEFSFTLPAGQPRIS